MVAAALAPPVAPVRRARGAPKRRGVKIDLLREDARQQRLVRSSVGRALSDGGRSWLEEHAVADSTLTSYQIKYATWRDFCQRSGLPTGSRQDDEVALLEWADAAFSLGMASADGTAMLAAYTHHHPENGRFGQPLARVARALQAWGKLVPPAGRVPPAFSMVCGIAVALTELGRRDMAVGALVALSAYLRPGELIGLRGGDVVRPMPQFGPAYRHWSLVLGSTAAEEARPTKTGIYDDSVILDHEELQWLSPMLEMMVSSREPLEYLWDFNDQLFRQKFEEAAALAGLARLGLVPYSLRHAGPSWDAIRRRRSQREIQRRGRWASPTSVQRYERSSRVVATLQELPEETLLFLQHCEMHLAELVTGRIAAPRFPSR